MTSHEEIPTVQIHAWRDTPEGDREYADAELGELHDGWGVHLRVPTPDDPQQPFDIRFGRDFESQEAAEGYAEQLAAQHKVEIDRY